MGEAGCTVSVAGSPGEWRALAPCWNRLLSASRADTVFLTWEWLDAWVQTFLAPGRELFVLVVREGDEIVGLAPWYLARSAGFVLPVRSIAFLGSPETSSDYLDVIALKGREKRVALAIYDFLFGAGGRRWDAAALREIPAASLFLAHVVDRLRQDGRHHQIDISAHCPAVALPATTEELLAGLSSGRRADLRRHLRIVEREGAVEFREHPPGLDGKVWEAFFALYEQNWGRGDERARPFFQRYALQGGEGRLRMDALACDGRYLAGLLQVSYHGVTSGVLMAVDKSRAYRSGVSLGNLLLGQCLTKAVGEGIATYDFLKGLEDYKFHWANSGRTTLALSFCQRRPAPVLRVWGGLVKSAARAALR